MYKVVIKLNSLSNIIVNMNFTQFRHFQGDKLKYTWLTLNNYTDDLKDTVEINVNNISAIVYQLIHSYV